MKKKMSEQERKALQAKLRDLEELYQGTSWIFKEEMENEYKYAYFNRYHMHFSMCILYRLLYKVSD